MSEEREERHTPPPATGPQLGGSIRRPEPHPRQTADDTVTSRDRDQRAARRQGYPEGTREGKME